MSISVGGINLVDSAINAELRIAVLERILERLMSQLPMHSITQQEIEKIRAEVLVMLQTKYPDAGIRSSAK